MTTGLRCSACDTPLAECGNLWSCPEPSCPKFGKAVRPVDGPKFGKAVRPVEDP